MMKRIICILLMLMTFALPALAEGAPLAEETPFTPYALSAPEGVALEIGENSHTFISGVTRVVVQVIPRVPDENPAEAIIRMMAQFEPDAVLGEDIPMAEGYVGLNAVNTDKYGEGVDQLNVMVLSTTGDLLILSGYDLEGDETKVQSLLDALFASLTVDGTAIVITE